ncbi:MAG TPA: FAD-binding protein, partial [Gemmatimonadaceae bacterium]|nr:FAD-binding protein [Gemmatimonadaceae bacterium]
MDRGARGPPVSAPERTAEVAALVRDAAARGRPLRIAGSGGWLDAGRPVAGAEPMLLDRIAGIVEYVPGDLTLTARAGTTLAAIRRATAAQRQFLPLDPFAKPSATLGATIATASWGPLAHAYGVPRDLVLGLEVVTGEGRVIRTGGRVWKNVAGFDLTRLHTGAWGTLGVITEATVRLRAMPEADETVAVGLGARDADGAIGGLLKYLRAAPVAPVAMEVLSPALAARLGVANRTVALVRLAGNAESVDAERRTLLDETRAAPVDGGVWRLLRESDPPDGAVLRLSGGTLRLDAMWADVRLATEEWTGAYAHATPARGVMRLVLPNADAARVTAALDFV